LRTLGLSEASGGAVADGIIVCVLAEELAAGDPDVAAVLVEISTPSRLLCKELMTPAQRERRLSHFLRDTAGHFRRYRAMIAQLRRCADDLDPFATNTR